MMKKTKIGAVVLMAAFAMMTVQPMTSMAAGICQTRICGGNSVNLYGTVPGNCFGQNAGSCQTGNNCKPGRFQNNSSCGRSVKNWNTSFGNWGTGCRKQRAEEMIHENDITEYYHRHGIVYRPNGGDDTMFLYKKSDLIYLHL